MDIIDRVVITKFRCFREIDVPLRALTVLIGPNDSGKSAFLRAIRLMSDQTSGFHPSEYWRNDTGESPVIRGHSSKGWIEITHGNVDDSSGVRANSLTPIGFFRLPSTGIEMECAGRDDGPASWNPGEFGENTAAVIDQMLRRYRRAFDSVLKTMKAMVTGLEDILVATPSPHARRIDIAFDGGLVLQGEEVSAGVRLLLFFVTLAFHPIKPKIILLEEPENGIHPKRLVDIIDLLRKITEGGFGAPPAQVLLTTHSPNLLNSIDVETDQVLIFQRGPDGDRTAEPADAHRIARFSDEFSLGEIWLNQFERGLVAKP